MDKPEFTIFDVDFLHSKNKKKKLEPLVEREEVGKRLEFLQRNVNARFAPDRTTASEFQVLAAAATNLINATHEYLDNYIEMVPKSLEVLRRLQREASELGPNTVAKIRKATRRAKIPHESRDLTSPVIIKALDETIEAIENQISEIENIHENIGDTIQQVAGDTLNSLLLVRQFAADKCCTATQNRLEDFTECRRVVLQNMSQHYGAIRNLRFALLSARDDLQAEVPLLEAGIRKARAQIDAASSIAQQSSGLLTSSGNQIVKIAIQYAWAFTSRKELFEPEYNMVSALIKLESLCRYLLDL